MKDVFGDVFEDFTFLDTGEGKIDAIKTCVGTWWIEDKPKNAFDGVLLGLVTQYYLIPNTFKLYYKQTNEFPESEKLGTHL